MKILFLTNLPTPYRTDFFNELGKKCELTVLYERLSASDRDKKWVGDENKYYQETFLKGINVGTDGALSIEIVKWIKKGKYDIVVVGGYSTPTGMLSIILLKILKIPFVLNSDGGFIKKDSYLKYRIKKFFIGSARWYLSTGKLTNKYLEHYGANRKNIYIYPFTSIRETDLREKLISEHEKIKLRKELGLEDVTTREKKIILSVGRLIECKGYEDLIRIWKKLPNNYELVIVGSGEKKNDLEELIENYKLENVKLIGFKTKKELEKYYLIADLFILLTKEDIWGLVINEALAYNLPIITTDTCIAGVEILESGINGYIVQRNNEEEIIDKIKYLIMDKDLNYSMKLNNLDKSRNYTIENMSNVTYSIFKNILKDRIL